jgi:hypothetical protein
MPPESVERHFERPSFHSLSFSFAMDPHPDHSSILPADNAVQARNLLDDVEGSHPTSPFDKTGMGHSDPQTILNDLYPPSARHRGRSIDGSDGADRESESVRQIFYYKDSFISHLAIMPSRAIQMSFILDTMSSRRMRPLISYIIPPVNSRNKASDQLRQTCHAAIGTLKARPSLTPSIKLHST